MPFWGQDAACSNFVYLHSHKRPPLRFVQTGSESCAMICYHFSLHCEAVFVLLDPPKPALKDFQLKNPHLCLCLRTHWTSWRWTTTGRRWRTSPAPEKERWGVKVAEKGKFKRRSSRKPLRVRYAVFRDGADRDIKNVIVVMCLDSKQAAPEGDGSSADLSLRLL